MLAYLCSFVSPYPFSTQFLGSWVNDQIAGWQEMKRPRYSSNLRIKIKLTHHPLPHKCPAPSTEWKLLWAHPYHITPPVFPLYCLLPHSATMRVQRSWNAGWDPGERRQEACSCQSCVSDVQLEVNSSHNKMSVYLSFEVCTWERSQDWQITNFRGLEEVHRDALWFVRGGRDHQQVVTFPLAFLCPCHLK